MQRFIVVFETESPDDMKQYKELNFIKYAKKAFNRYIDSHLESCPNYHLFIGLDEENSDKWLNFIRSLD